MRIQNFTGIAFPLMRGTERHLDKCRKIFFFSFFLRERESNGHSTTTIAVSVGNTLDFRGPQVRLVAQRQLVGNGHQV